MISDLTREILNILKNDESLRRDLLSSADTEINEAFHTDLFVVNAHWDDLDGEKTIETIKEILDDEIDYKFIADYFLDIEFDERVRRNIDTDYRKIRP